MDPRVDRQHLTTVSYRTGDLLADRQQLYRFVQPKKAIDFYAGLGIAVREYQTHLGPADYVLFVGKKVEQPAGAPPGAGQVYVQVEGQPSAVKVNDTVRDTEEMLRRTLGEHVELVYSRAAQG